MPRVRQRSSWGSNEPAARKGYRRLRYWADEGDGKGYCRRSMTIKGTKRDGDSKLAELRVMYEEQRSAGPRPTFSSAWERWYLPELETRLQEGSLRPQTLRLYRNEWRLRVEPRWGAAALQDVRPDEYQEWLLSLGHNQARLSNILIGNIAQCAAFHGARGIEFKKWAYRIPKQGTEVKERNARVYSLEQLRQIAVKVEGTVLEVPFILSAFGSCRVGEACAPLLSDVGETSVRGMRLAVVRINKQLTMRGYDLAPVKNEQSERPVVITEPWGARLLQIRDERRSAGLAYLNDDGLCEPVARATVSSAWRRAFEDGGLLAGMPYLPLQKLRNSWETFMRWELHVDKDKIDKMMGHTSGDVRSKHYDRPDEILFAETVASAFEAKG